MAPSLDVLNQIPSLPLKPSFTSRRNFPPTAKLSPVKPFKNHQAQYYDSSRIDDAHSTLDLKAELDVLVDLRTYSSLLRSCIRSRDLHHGRLLHRRLVLSGLPFDSTIFNSLITLYSKCGDLDSAISVFNQMGDERDLVSWTAMISAAVENNMQGRALSIFLEMIELGFIPNEFTLSSVIHACSNPCFGKVGILLLGSAIKTGFGKRNASVAGALIDMLAKNGDLASARKVFDEILEKNEVVWTLMITRYAQHGLCMDAVKLFLEFLFDDFVPDQFSLSSVISACAELESVLLGKQLHSLAIRVGFVCEVCVGCSLVNMYAKCAQGTTMDDSRKVFDRMPNHNVMSWTAVISGYVQSGRNDEQALSLFLQMLEGKIKPNHFTYSSILKACANLSNIDLGKQVYTHVIKTGLAFVNIVGNSLVTMFTNSGSMEDACKAFEVLYEKNLISYNALVDGYVKNLNSEEVFEIFQQMKSMNLGANTFTFASLLSSAASIGVMTKGQQLHAQLLKMGFESDICINNALISMYSRCGNVEDACNVFDEMKHRNVISWTSMITGFAKHGDGHCALQLFHEMISTGLRPNEITYVAVLSACSHVGLVREGIENFYSMQRDHGLVPRMEHYACMVDLLGRSGFVKEAFRLITSMPFKADVMVWKTLLSACRIHQNVELGEMAAKNVIELEPSDPAAYILLSNLYAVARRWRDVAKLRSVMKEMKLSKEAGLSWIEVDKKMHKFHVADTSHPQAKEIFEKLDELVEEIKKMGYVPDIDCVLHDMVEDLKERYLLQHSEKIAVAFGLLSTESPRPIRVFKNLRVCGDCHTAIKFISMKESREIILRDSNRFHRFRNGECSCGDYW
ncbi:pentatricopeptide repeat-containing protein At3g49170, chloroplastic [Phalaenopsis equestris]|uniref:pentatricopeptide repeat-containing protein At3g49170, chloroplastic n=1 Tax=Phalaenopsis equestris TaxID=78828 RepID=UPI0009E5D888|nr:pentatricopeptide repeat-containing protein At3g49170, chloroplastic [Phalaenopsis equestris]